MIMMPGDRVRLNVPQSRVMVIDAIVDVQGAIRTGMQYGVHCVWHDDIGRPHREVYSGSALIKESDRADEEKL